MLYEVITLANRIGLLPRQRGDWNRKDGEDKFWTPELGREMWLVGTRPEVWTERPATRPHVAGACIDGPRITSYNVCYTKLLRLPTGMVTGCETANGICPSVKPTHTTRTDNKTPNTTRLLRVCTNLIMTHPPLIKD